MQNSVKLTIPYKYDPRPYQRTVFQKLESGIKRMALVWHRRSGKDKTCLNVQIKWAYRNPGVYYYFYPTYSQGRKALWDTIGKDQMKMIDHIPKEIRIGKPNEDEMKIKIRCSNGAESIWQIVGVDKIDSVVGTNPSGVVFSEYSLQNPMGWQLIRPILTENGGWALFNFTPRGNNHAKDLYDRASKSKHWYVSMLTVDDTKDHDGNPVLTKAQIDLEREEGMPEELIQQEYYGSFSGCLFGSYYGASIEKAQKGKRIGNVPWEPALDVHTWWDIGRDGTAIWFGQLYKNEVRLIDYYEIIGESLTEAIREVKSKEYVYANHYAPHDIEVHEYSSGTSRLETARKLGIRFKKIPRVKLDEGVDAVRRILPRCWFDEKSCKKGLDCLQNYHKKYDERTKMFSDHPVHDWASHGADAFRGLALTVRAGEMDDKKSEPQAVTEHDFSVF